MHFSPARCRRLLLLLVIVVGCGPAKSDRDGDGIRDGRDNCPEDANPEQADADGDGQGDACDACPSDPDNDVDGDGICADDDNCPEEANPDQGDTDGDGIGDVCDEDCVAETDAEMCARLSAECGSLQDEDNCGESRTIDSCGTCDDADDCGAGGSPNVCGCDAATCAELGANCGPVDDGCGGSLDCGECEAPESCGGGGAENVCGCMPATCEDSGAECGTVPDGCFGNLDCGGCMPPATCGGGGVQNECGLPELPPDPSAIAPVLDVSVPTRSAESLAFLFEGDDPVQREVQPGAVAYRRAALVRGKVIDLDGEPLPGVRVSVLDDPDLGHTLSRADGMFDLVVNGGGEVVLRFGADGLVTAHRHVTLPWEGTEVLPDVAMVQLDERATTIELDASVGVQVARASEVSDEDGTRRATLMFMPDTQAAAQLDDGTTMPLDQLSVRATELTVGDHGPAAMPAELPPSTAYTYALELSVGEADDLGADSVELSEPVVVYLENFLGFRTGSPVPVGYYDRERALWLPEPDGWIVEVVAIDDGVAEMDLDGDGTPEAPGVLEAFGIDLAERMRVAELYEPGQSLWRVPVRHFSTFDFNWPYRWADGAKPPPTDACTKDNDPESTSSCQSTGSSVIECENQVLGEDLELVGAPHTLHYRSSRVPGRHDGRTMRIQLTGDQVSPVLQGVRYEVHVAGRRFHGERDADPNQRVTITWDGRDVYGRPMQGTTTARVRIEYLYEVEYYEPGTRRPGTPVDGGSAGDSLVSGGSSFGGPATGPMDGIETRTGIRAWSREYEVPLTVWDARGSGLGGWTLDVHHAYDPGGKKLYLGTGSMRTIDRDVDDVITTITSDPTTAVAVAPDGTIYYAGFIYDDGVGANQIWRRLPDGTAERVAGQRADEPTSCELIQDTGEVPCDGVPAIEVGLGPANLYDSITDLEVGRDGRLYFAVGRLILGVFDGVLRHIAGNNEVFYGGAPTDPMPATELTLGSALDIRLGPDGALYVGDLSDYRLIRIDDTGWSTHLARYGCLEPGPGGVLCVRGVSAIDVDSRGFVYLMTHPSGPIRVIDPTGTEVLEAGYSWHIQSYSGGVPNELAVRSDGTAHFFFPRVESEDFVKVVSLRPFDEPRALYGGEPWEEGEDVPAVRSNLRGPFHWQNVSAVNTADFDWGPDGRVYLATTSGIRRIAPPLAGVGTDDIAIPSSDGSEVYIFDPAGKHLRTLNGLSGALRYEFAYDDYGLASVTDAFGNETRIERSTNGALAAIVGPYGQRTELETDAMGYLRTVTDPAGRAYSMAYGDTGLLQSVTDPRDLTSSYEYDAQGYLVSATAPGDSTLTLSRVEREGGRRVTKTTGEGVVTRYDVYSDPDHAFRRVVTDGAGLQHVTSTLANGSERVRSPDGTVATMTYGPDPRWGMAAPLVEDMTVDKPDAGLTYSLQTTSVVELSDPGDLFSVDSIENTTVVNGRASVSTYDGATGAWTSTTPEGRASEVILDEHGRTLSASLDGLAARSFEYDAQGRLEAAVVGEGEGARRMGLSYASTGLVQSISDPLAQSNSFVYDDANQMTSQVLADGRIVAFDHDAAGNLTGLTPPGRPEHGFAYGDRGLLAAYTPPGDGDPSTYYSYDADRRLQRVARPDGRELVYTYDSAGRPTSIASPAGAITYAYSDVTGQLESLGGPAGVSLGYDWTDGLLAAVTWGGDVGGTVSFAYDSDSRIAGVSVGDGDLVEYTYDQDGLLVGVGPMTVTRDAAHGMVTGSTLDNATTSNTYNGFGELADLTASTGTDLLFEESVLERDALGRITAKAETLDGVSTAYEYAYDLAGRLTDVWTDTELTAHYEYDDNGNRTLHQAGAEEATATYDDQDRMLTYGENGYAYTANGELTSKTSPAGETSYDYDVLGNLRSVGLPDGTLIEYLVDGQGRRVGKAVDGELERAWLYQDQLNPVAELNGDGEVVARFVYGTRAHVPDYMVQGGVTYRIVADHLGSVRLVVDASSGDVVQRMDYDEFGNVLADTNPEFQPFGFAGGLYDAGTGLVRFGARDYDAETGRWTAKDPAMEGSPGFNLYAYGRLDPLNRIDVSGRISIDSSVVLHYLVLVLIFPAALPTYYEIAGLSTLELLRTVREMNRTRILQFDPEYPESFRRKDWYFHCLAHCRATRWGWPGQDASHILGELHEEPIRGDEEAFEAACDKDANSRGRASSWDCSLCDDVHPGFVFE